MNLPVKRGASNGFRAPAIGAACAQCVRTAEPPPDALVVGVLATKAVDLIWVQREGDGADEGRQLRPHLSDGAEKNPSELGAQFDQQVDIGGSLTRGDDRVATLRGTDGAAKDGIDAHGAERAARSNGAAPAAAECRGRHGAAIVSKAHHAAIFYSRRCRGRRYRNRRRRRRRS